MKEDKPPVRGEFASFNAWAGALEEWFDAVYEFQAALEQLRGALSECAEDARGEFSDDPEFIADVRKRQNELADRMIKLQEDFAAKK